MEILSRVDCCFGAYPHLLELPRSSVALLQWSVDNVGIAIVHICCWGGHILLHAIPDIALFQQIKM